MMKIVKVEIPLSDEDHAKYTSVVQRASYKSLEDFFFKAFKYLLRYELELTTEEKEEKETLENQLDLKFDEQ